MGTRVFQSLRSSPNADANACVQTSALPFPGNAFLRAKLKGFYRTVFRLIERHASRLGGRNILFIYSCKPFSSILETRRSFHASHRRHRTLAGRFRVEITQNLRYSKTFYAGIEKFTNSESNGWGGGNNREVARRSQKVTQGRAKPMPVSNTYPWYPYPSTYWRKSIVKKKIGFYFWLFSNEFNFDAKTAVQTINNLHYRSLFPFFFKL